MENLPFLEGNEPEEAVIEDIQPEATPVEDQPQSEAPVRDEHGRFAPKDKPEQPMVPLAALHETRDRLRDLEARLAQQEQQPEPQPIPDVFEDQQGFTTAIQSQIQQALYTERLNMSQRFAEQKFGADEVTAALEWGRNRCASDPGFNASVMGNPDPVGYAVEQYRRDQIASQVSLDEYEQFKAWKSAQETVQQPQAPQPAPTPPRSINSLPSSGGAAHVPIGPGQAFDTLFTR